LTGALTPRKVLVLAIMCMKKQELIGNYDDLPEIVCHCCKRIYTIMADSAPRKGELKNEGLSHYVIENKHTEISVPVNPIISMKIKDLFF